MSELVKQITALKNAIAEAEKVTADKGFKPSAVAKAQQIVAELKRDLTRLERKLADQQHQPLPATVAAETLIHQEKPA